MKLRGYKKYQQSLPICEKDVKVWIHGSKLKKNEDLTQQVHTG